MSKQISRNAFALAIVQIANYVSPLIVLMHLTKTLGQEIYGVLAFSQGLIATGAILVDFGYGMSATNKASKNRHNKNYLCKLLNGTLLVKLILFALFSLGIVIYAYTNSKYSEYSLIFVVSLFPLVVQMINPLWIFHGLEKIKHYAIILILTKIIFAALCVQYVNNRWDYYLVHIFNGLSQLIALLGSIIYLYKNGYKIKIPKLGVVAYCYKFSKQFFLSRVAVATYMNGGVIVLGLSANPTIVATYSMAEQLYKVMQTALAPIAAAAYPYMANKKDLGLMIKLILIVTGVAALGAAVGYIVSPTLLIMIFDESWLNTLPILNVFLIAIVIHAATVMMGYPLAALLDRLEVANYSVMAGAVTYMTILGISYFFEIVTPINMAYIMIISESIVLIYRCGGMMPEIKKRINLNAKMKELK